MTQSKWFAYLCVALLAATACSSSSKKLDFGGTCKVNSDCNDPLSCAFGTCHQQCAQIRDCPQGDRCVSVNGVGVCQLPAEASCAGTGTGNCDPSLLCAGDNICRTRCSAAGTCSLSQTCGVDGTCMDPNESAVLYGDAGVKTDAPALAADGPAVTGADGPVVTGADGPVVTGADGPVVAIDGPTLGKDGPASANGDVGGGADVPVTGGGGSGGGGASGGAGGGGGTVTVCPQTQFGFVAQGDTNPNFFSGVGLRTAKQLLIFSGYTGPDPNASPDGGTPSTVDAVYVQAFDPVTAKSAGPAQFLFTPQFSATAGYNDHLRLGGAAISPTGQIALLYRGGKWGTWGIGALSVAFLDAAPSDAGAPAGLQVNHEIQLDVKGVAVIPQVIWSATYGVFVISWQNSSGVTTVRKLYPDGRSLGGDTDSVPTTDSSSATAGTSWAVVANGSKYLGVFYLDSVAYAPYLTILDAQGNQVGHTFPLKSPPARINWITAAGTSTGFVVFYNDYYNPYSGHQGVNGSFASFVPVAADGTISAGQYTDAGVLADTLQFSGAKDPRFNTSALNDDVGGAGGVGLALQYDDGVSFAYLNADRTIMGPAQIWAHSLNSSNDYVNISNFAGSFAVSQWSDGEHLTRIAATTCPQ